MAVRPVPEPSRWGRKGEAECSPDPRSLNSRWASWGAAHPGCQGFHLLGLELGQRGAMRPTPHSAWTAPGSQPSSLRGLRGHPRHRAALLRTEAQCLLCTGCHLIVYNNRFDILARALPSRPLWPPRWGLNVAPQLWPVSSRRGDRHPLRSSTSGICKLQLRGYCLFCK